MSSPAASTASPAARRPWREFLLLFGLGFIGVLVLAPGLVPAIEQLLATDPDAPQLPTWALALISLINPTLLLAISVGLGVALAWRVGLSSHLADHAATGRSPWKALRSEFPTALVGGVVAAVILVFGDALSLPLLGEHAAHLNITSGRTLYSTLAGILYGGITEELQLRWGVMTLLVFAMSYRAVRSGGRPSATVMWLAIILSALLFGLLHLPAVATVLGSLDTPVILRTVLLNASGGIIFGWLYWKRSLESAMIAHATAHVAITVIALMLHAGH